MYSDPIRQLYEYFRAQSIAVDKGTNSIGMPKTIQLPSASLAGSNKGDAAYDMGYGMMRSADRYDPLKRVSEFNARNSNNYQKPTIGDYQRRALEHQNKAGGLGSDRNMTGLFKDKDIYRGLAFSPQYSR